MEDILIGVTDRTIPVFIPDPSSTTGAGKTGLAAAAITVTYARYETDNDVVHTDVTSSVNDLTALTDAHNDWGWKEVSSTLSKGQYRLDIADAVFASGAWYAVVQVTVTSGTAAATPKAFRLVARNDLDGVRLGLTALPNAAADAAGGLPISDAGGLDLDAQLVTKVNDILTDTAEIGAAGAGLTNINLPNQTMDIAGNITGNLSGSVGSVTGAVGSIGAGGITAASFGANAITAAKLDPDVTTELQAGLATAAAVATLQTSVDDVPTNAELATSQAAADDATLAAIATLQTTADDIPTNAELATALGTADDAVLAQVALVKAKTDNLPSDPADQSLVIAATDALATLIGDVPTNAELAAAVPTTAQIADKVLGRNLAGGSDGGRMVKDALRFQRNKWTLIGTTLTVYEENDTDIAWTATITKTAGDPVSASDPA